MKILNKEEAAGFVGRGRGRNTLVRKGLAKLQVGEIMIIEKGKDWLSPTPPYFSIRRFAKSSGRTFRYGRTMDETGWWAERLS